MVSFPNCKINLGLSIIGKRSDGYHDLETVFYPLQLKDALEIIETDVTNLSISGFSIDDNSNNNLCIKAYNLLKQDFPDLPSIKIYLHKEIPLGAGLGGGSSDATFSLKLLDKKFGLALSEKKLLEYSLQLGSDCPFFVVNKPCFASGRGEILEQVALDLSSYKFFIVHPGIHINTGAAFSKINPCIPKKTIKETIQRPISTWKATLKNDFEEYAFAQYPEIKKIKDEFYNAGAFFASMTGSGSAVYGIFEKENRLSFSFPGNYFTKELLG